MSIRQRVDVGLTALRDGLNPFIRSQMENEYRGGWVARAKQSLREESFKTDRSGNPIFDVTALCNILLDHWQSVFGRILGKAEQRIIHRVRDARNDFAHQRDITVDRAIGVFEDIEALLNAVGAGSEALKVQQLKEETGRERYGGGPPLKLLESETEKALLQSEKMLIPWREVIVPHADVRTRRFLNAEFAANLFEVWDKTRKGLKVSGDEYADPIEFFSRTFMTSGLRMLLRNAAQRVSRRGGEPVVELQTNFGGGKTHALLALFHLTSGQPFSKLPGASEMLADTGIRELPSIRRAVLVGTNIQAGQPEPKPEGIQVRTIWGELAYQLGGSEGYAMVSGADGTSTNPGAALGDLLKRYAPCVILIDEWVAYARQLTDETTLCGGTFDTQFSFAQTLTEKVSAVDGTMLVFTLPMSEAREEGNEIEVGGARGREALRRLRNVVGRVQANWQPADPSESYAIVRRRLFEPLKEAESKLRDRAVGVIHKYYREKEVSFPKYASDPSYRQKLLDCYPLHPELFERLYNDWGSLEQFQRTRGVLRLMAAAIHTLWSKDDQRPLIMPGTLPLEDHAVKSDLTRYLGNQNQWDSVLSRDVLGDDSVAGRVDAKDRRLGRHNAAQRAARAIFLATAPAHAEGSSGRGDVDLRSIRLACAFPGEQLAAFDDAVRRLTEEGTHVNTDGTRYWFGLAPNLNQRVANLAAQYEQEPHLVQDEIIRRLGEWQRERAAFARIHSAPGATSDVPEEPSARLVVLGPAVSHRRGREDSSGRKQAMEFIAKCGEADRRYKNCLVFLTADESRLDDLRGAVRRWLAWKKILDDHTLRKELTGAQQATAEQRRTEAEDEARRLLRASWVHGLVPEQAAEVGAPIGLIEMRVDSGEPAPVAFSRRLEAEGKLVTRLGGVYLRHELDNKGLWRDRNHVPIQELHEDFARYPYLMRLKDESVLADSVQSSIASTAWDVETFAYADSYDDVSGTYRGLAPCSGVVAHVDMVRGLIVRPEVAVAQLARMQIAAGVGAIGPLSAGPGGDGAGGTTAIAIPTSVTPAIRPRRFFQRVAISDPTVLSRVVNKLGNDIVALLAAKGAHVDVAIEVTAEVDAGIDRGLEDRLRGNAAAHDFPPPEFDP